jgi:hypothetical protein
VGDSLLKKPSVENLPFKVVVYARAITKIYLSVELIYHLLYRGDLPNFLRESPLKIMEKAWRNLTAENADMKSFCWATIPSPTLSPAQNDFQMLLNNLRQL